MKNIRQLVINRAIWIFLPILVWTIVSYFELVGENILSSGNMYVAVVLFLLGMPLSIVVGFDKIARSLSGDGITTIIFVGGLVAVINLTLLSFLLRSWRNFRKRQSSRVSKPLEAKLPEAEQTRLEKKKGENSGSVH